MNESAKNLKAKRFFIFILLFLLITVLAVLLDIPILRQIFGLLTLAVIPGLLILFLLKLNKLGTAEKAVLIIGLSIAFHIFFGLIFNQLSLQFDYTKPLATNPLIFVLSGILVVLAIAAYWRNREAFSSFPFHLNLNTNDKLLLLLPSILLLLSILGTQWLRTSDNNILLLTVLFLIPISVILIVFSHRKVSKDTYAIAIVVVAIIPLIMYWLRSEHILGHDVHLEYYMFKMTLLNSHWGILGVSTLDSCLSISLLPAMFQSILAVPGEEYLFQGIYVLISAFTPLVVYVISRKYIRDLYAFLAALFFTFQVSFMSTAGNPRTNIAVFFFALSIMTLFHSKITGARQHGLFIIFMLAVIVSHYASSYIFFMLLFFTYLAGLTLKRYVVSRSIPITAVVLFLVLLFLWYSQMLRVPFEAGVAFLVETVRSLSGFFIEEARSEEVSLLIGGVVAEKTILGYINFAITWITFALIGTGIIGTLIKRKDTISTSKQANSPPDYLRSRFDMEYFLLAVASCGLLAIMLIVPYISRGYDIFRTYSQVAVLTSMFFILGGIILSKYLRISSRLLILLVLITYLLFTTGAIYGVLGRYTNMTLNTSEAPSSQYELVYDQEVESAQWLKEHSEKYPRIYTTYPSGWRKLISQGGIHPNLINWKAFYQHQAINGYLYLTHNNVVNGRVGNDFDMSDYSDMFVDKDKIYTNGGSEIYK